MDEPEARTPSESRVLTHALMLPEHANHMGHVHGGWIMKLIDEAGGLAAMRHCRLPVVTVAVDGMVFHRPVKTGSVLQLDAQVASVGRTSIDVVVEVSREDPFEGTLELVNTAHMVYVALGPDHRPTPVAPLRPSTPQEIRRRDMVLERKRQRSGG